MSAFTGGLLWLSCLSPRVMEVNLADLDGNGTLDAVLANGRFGEPYTYPKEIQYQILFNDGEVNFSRQGQLPEIWNNTNVALDDLNGDGAIDIVIGGSSVLVYDNDGRGIFDNFKRLPEIRGYRRSQRRHRPRRFK
jgi:hypothetical protein